MATADADGRPPDECSNRDDDRSVAQSSLISGSKRPDGEFAAGQWGQPGFKPLYGVVDVVTEGRRNRLIDVLVLLQQTERDMSVDEVAEHRRHICAALRRIVDADLGYGLGDDLNLALQLIEVALDPTADLRARLRYLACQALQREIDAVSWQPNARARWRAACRHIEELLPPKGSS